MSAISGWKVCELDELAHLDVDTLSASTPRDFQFYYLDISSASEGRLDLPSTETQFFEAPSRARKVVHRHDVLMSMVRPNLKAFAFFDHTDGLCVASTGFAVLTAKENASPKFLLYAILSENVSRQIDGLVIGSNYPAINSSAVRSLKILAPPVPEQAKIAEVLSTVDRAIEQTEALIAKQQRIKTGLMQDLLTRGIDEHGNPRSESTHPFKDSPLGRIPVEWEVSSLERCVKQNAPICYGILMPGTGFDGGIPVIKVKDITGGRILQNHLLLTDPKIDRQYKRSRLRAGDLVITIRGTTGRIAAVPPELDGANITQDTARLRIKEECSTSYFYFLLQSKGVQEQVLLHSVGQAVKGINISEVKRISFPLPSKPEQEAIGSRMAESEHSLSSSAHDLSKLRTLKTALMQDLLTGRKRVTTLLEHDGK